MRARNCARERAASAAKPLGLVSRAVAYARLLVARARERLATEASNKDNGSIFVFVVVVKLLMLLNRKHLLAKPCSPRI